MNSLSIITDKLDLKERFLKKISIEGAEIIRVDDNTRQQHISMPDFKDQFNKLQYVLLYMSKMPIQVIKQYEQKEREKILGKQLEPIYSYSLEYNANKAIDLLSYLVDKFIEVIIQTNVEERILVTEDTTGEVYSFDEFINRWNEKKVFWE